MPPSRASTAAASKPGTVHAVLLTTKGETKKATITLEADDHTTLSLTDLQHVFKKKELPERLGEYEHERMLLSLFGYTKGKKGSENKTILPAPYHQQPFYGDILVTAASLSASWEEPISLIVDQWTTFCDTAKEEELEDDVENDEDADVEEDAEEVEEDVDEVEEDVEEDAEDAEAEEELELDVDEAEEDAEPVAPVKRRRAPVYNKVDTAGIKEDILPDAPPESNTLRTKCLSGFGFLLSLGFTEEDICALEKAIFDASFQSAQLQYIPRSWQSPLFCETYRQLVRSILSNLHPASPVKNMRLLTRIREGEFTLAALPYMTSYEMFPEHWFMMKDKQLQREQKILEGNKSRATDQFKCRRCQKRECTYYELQTRSADEPMTIFITCLNCGKEWRQGG